MEWTTILIKLGGAFAAGGIIGIERQVSGKAAGIRTNILICVGATVMAMVGLASTQDFTEAGRILSDPQRIAAGIVTGIGFLGAGAIIQSRGSIHGLTTAATIGVLAGIGVTIGFGYFRLAGAATTLTVATLYVIEKIARRLAADLLTVHYLLVAEPGGEILDEVLRSADEVDAKLEGLRIDKGLDVVTVQFDAQAKRSAQAKLANVLLELPTVRSLG